MGLPEKTTLPALQNQQPSTRDQMALALNGIRINECTDEQIKEVIRYGIMLIGIPKDKHGDEFAKMVLVNYLRTTYPMVRLDELRLSFDFAVSKKTNANVTLYQGEIISARFVSEILAAYIELKKTNKIVKIASSPVIQMNNSQRLSAILDFLTDDTKKKVSDIGKTEVKPLDRKKLPYHDVHQNWFKQFDKHFLTRAVEFGSDGKSISGRFIKRYGKCINVEEFFNHKVDQLRLSMIRGQYGQDYRIEKVEGKMPNPDKAKKGTLVLDWDKTHYILLTEKKL